MIVKGLTGTTYDIEDKEFVSGGEGGIHRLKTKSSGQVVKIYNDLKRKDAVAFNELREKLLYMRNNPPEDSLLDQVAWPLDLVSFQNGQFCGFLMPELKINSSLKDLYSYPPKTKLSLDNKVTLALNICAVISEVHRKGFVFGDFNPLNIGVDGASGIVAFLDTDSYHVYDPGPQKTYRCTVALDGYVAPELVAKCDALSKTSAQSGGAFNQITLPSFTKETDNFALAIHIFKLLMNGFTPFGGILESANASTSSPGQGNDAIRRDNYCFKPGHKPLSQAVPSLETLPQDIARLFNRAFIDGKSNPKARPTAEEWHSSLMQFQKSMVTCSVNQLHNYDRKNKTCPYCDADRSYQQAVGGSAPVPQPISLQQQTFNSAPAVSPQLRPATPRNNNTYRPPVPAPVPQTGISKGTKRFLTVASIVFLVWLATTWFGGADDSPAAPAASPQAVAQPAQEVQPVVAVTSVGSFEGGSFDGQWLNGVPHGQGTFNFPNGGIYQGDWLNGQRHGWGMLVWTDGMMYEGWWENNQRHGEGTQWMPDGRILVGTWYRGEFTGYVPAPVETVVVPQPVTPPPVVVTPEPTLPSAEPIVSTADPEPTPSLIITPDPEPTSPPVAPTGDWDNPPVTEPTAEPQGDWDNWEADDDNDAPQGDW